MMPAAREQSDKAITKHWLGAFSLIQNHLKKQVAEAYEEGFWAGYKDGIDECDCDCSKVVKS